MQESFLLPILIGDKYSQRKGDVRRQIYLLIHTTPMQSALRMCPVAMLSESPSPGVRR